VPARKTGPRRPVEPKLVSAGDAARILGVRQTNLRAQVGLPEPYDVISSGALWREDDIREFARQRQQRRRRPADDAEEVALAA
jgi:hypothetical protein